MPGKVRKKNKRLPQYHKVVKRRQKVPLEIKVEKKNSAPVYSSLSKEEIEEKLHQFDFNYEYGPSQGITRLERWNRANTLLGMNPPAIVRDIIISDEAKYLETTWDKYFCDHFVE